MGDTVCCLPVATALKQAFPESHITWLVDPRFQAVVECCPSVDETVPYRPSFGIPPKLEPFELAFDLQGLFKSAWPVLWVKATEKFGYHWQREGAALASRRVLPDPTSVHIVDQYLDVARAAGATVDRAEFNLTPAPGEADKLRPKLGGAERLVVLNPGAGWITKRWPPESFAALADAVTGMGATPVLIGGNAAADSAAAEEVISRCSSKPVNLVGQTSITGLIALIAMAKAHVGGDTGSSHIAAALGIPAIGLYGITNPARSCPYGQIERCHYEPAGLAKIAPAVVIETVAEALA
jgi:heptosyltransferase I